MFNIIVTIFSSMLTITSCNTVLVEDNREKRSLSENLVVGMDYLGKPRIVCHCYGEEMQNLISKNMAMNRRSFIVKVNVDSTKNSGIREKRTVVNNTELIYAPVCCKINLSNKKSFYSYPFSVNLVALNYTDDLKDGNSEASQELSTILVAGLKTVLAKEKSVVSIGVDKFSNISGGVLANIYLTIQGMITQSIVDTLKATISSGNLGGIEVRIVPEPNIENAQVTYLSRLDDAFSATPSVSSSTVSASSISPSPTISASSESGSTNTTAALSTIFIISTTSEIQTNSSSLMSSSIFISPTSTFIVVSTSDPISDPSDKPGAKPYDPNTPAKLFDVVMGLILPNVTADISNPNSAEYEKIKSSIEAGIAETYKSNTDFASAVLISLKSLGVSKVYAAVKRSTTTEVTVEATVKIEFKVEAPGHLAALNETIKNGSLGELKVYPKLNAAIVSEYNPISCPAICVDTTLCQPSCPANCCAPSVSVCQQPSCPTACAPGCTDACCSIGQRRVRQKY